MLVISTEVGEIHSTLEKIGVLKIIETKLEAGSFPNNERPQNIRITGVAIRGDTRHGKSTQIDIEYDLGAEHVKQGFGTNHAGFTSEQLSIIHSLEIDESQSFSLQGHWDSHAAE